MRTGGIIDLTETNVNIDNLLDVFIQTQREHGVDVGMVEVDVHVDDDGKVTRDKFGHHAEERAKKNPCSACESSCEKPEKEEDTTMPWYMVNRMGLFGEDASDEVDIDDDDEEDGVYICGYCNDIGFKKEYKSYICDTCHACETCSEFESGDCDGCSYSMYRTGEFYSKELEKKGNHSFLEEGETELISSIEDGDFDDETGRGPDHSFTVMNYDHSYGK